MNWTQTHQELFEEVLRKPDLGGPLFGDRMVGNSVVPSEEDYTRHGMILHSLRKHAEEKD